MKSTTTTLKAASHRKAIEEAAAINGTKNSSTATGKLPQASTKGGPAVTKSKPPSAPQSAGFDTSNLSSISFTTGPSGDPLNDDYEGCKIVRAKKSQYDADVRAVADLDRWG